jgi:hypothetical protein
MTSPRFMTFALVFACVYPVAYILIFEFNWAAFTYHSALGEFGIGANKPRTGPAMYWFGWIASAVVLSSALSLLATRFSVISDCRGLNTGAWAIPLAAIAILAGLMVQMYFLR